MSNELIKVEGQSGITATGWNIEAVTQDEWNDAGKVLVQVDQARQWWLGDWWNACKWGNGKKVCEELGINHTTAMSCGTISKAFEPLRRRKGLPHSHHREVLKLDEEMQDKFLDMAEEEGWTRSFLRRKVQEYLAMSDWSESERQRRFDVEGGLTVVANMDKETGDINLINWAKQNGMYVFIGRSQFDIGWGNPFDEKDGTREEACDAHIRYFKDKKGLHDKVKDLNGKVLGCYCYPKRCHGDHLAAIANGEVKL